MPETNELLGLAIDKNPVDFADVFDQLIRQKTLDAIEAKRVEIAQSLYGGSEDGEDTGDDIGDDENFDIDDLDLDDIDLDIDLQDLDLDNEGITDENA